MQQGDHGLYGDSGRYSNVQRAVYAYLNEWCKANNMSNRISIKPGKYTTVPASYKPGADDYVSKYTKTPYPTISYNDKDQKNIDNVTIDGKDMIKIGPFKLNITGDNIKEFKVLDLDNNKITGVKFGKYEGRKFKTIDGIPNKSWIGSDNEIFILVPTDIDVSKVKIKIEVEGGKHVINTDIWVLRKEGEIETDRGDYQDIITTYGWTETKTVSKEFDLGTYEVLGELKIVKEDKNNHEKKLQGVKFIFKNVDTGKYVKQTNGKIEYVSEKSQATEFVTDKDGKIEIDKLIIGKYKAYEIENPNYGYELPNDGFDVQAKAKGEGKDKIIELENEQKWVKLSGYVWNDAAKRKN